MIDQARKLVFVKTARLGNHLVGTLGGVEERKKTARMRERRHVKTAVATNVQLHARAKSCASGEVPEVVSHATSAAENAAIPATPAARDAAASRMIPEGLPSISTLSRVYFFTGRSIVSFIPSLRGKAAVPFAPRGPCQLLVVWRLSYFWTIFQ